MRTWDFWTEVTTKNIFNDLPTVDRVLDEELLADITKAPLPERADTEVGVALARLAHEQFEGYGTGGAEISTEQSAQVMRALRAVLSRLGVPAFDPPFRDFNTFHKHWRRMGASGAGGWQARRDILDEHFEPLHVVLEEREAGSLSSTLAKPVSPRPITGWPRVDEEVTELRRHFESASTQQDYSNVGNDCVAVMEAISAAVYQHERHGRAGESEPAASRTKDRLDRFVEVSLPGSDNAELRKLARSTIEFAQAVKHRRATVTRMEAGLAADAVILLANMMRRVDLGQA